MLLRVIICFILCVSSFAAHANVLPRLARSGLGEVVQRTLDDIGKHARQIIDINAQDRYGKTALHRAIEDGDIEEVERLLQRGAKIDILDANNNTAVSLAVENPRIMAVLMRYNANTTRSSAGSVLETMTIVSPNGRVSVITPNGTLQHGEIVAPGAESMQNPDSIW